MSRLLSWGSARRLGACLVALLLGPGLAPRVLHATASGCTRFSGYAPQQESLNEPPECSQKGDGCYQCGYTNSGTPGYTLCAENPDGSGALCGSFDQLPDNWPEPDEPDPTPGQPPPDAPPPDTPDPGDGGGGGGGGGTCDADHPCADGVVLLVVQEHAGQVTAVRLAGAAQGGS
jgi:hypothetical protein